MQGLPTAVPDPRSRPRASLAPAPAARYRSLRRRLGTRRAALRGTTPGSLRAASRAAEHGRAEAVGSPRPDPGRPPPPAAGSRAAPAAAPRGAGLAPPLIDGRGRPMAPAGGGPARAAGHAPRPRPGPARPALPPPGRRLPAEEPPRANFAARPLRRAAASRAERRGLREEPAAPAPPGRSVPERLGPPGSGIRGAPREAAALYPSGELRRPGGCRPLAIATFVGRPAPPAPRPRHDAPRPTRPPRAAPGAAGARPGEEGRAGQGALARRRRKPRRGRGRLRTALHRPDPARRGHGGRGGGWRCCIVVREPGPAPPSCRPLPPRPPVARPRRPSLCAPPPPAEAPRPRPGPRSPPLGGARCGPGTPSARAAGPRHGAAGARPGQSLRPTPRRCPAAAAAWARCSERSCHWGQGAGTRKRGGRGALLAHAHTHTHTHTPARTAPPAASHFAPPGTEGGRIRCCISQVRQSLLRRAGRGGLRERQLRAGVRPGRPGPRPAGRPLPAALPAAPASPGAAALFLHPGRQKTSAPPIHTHRHTNEK